LDSWFPALFAVTLRKGRGTEPSIPMETTEWQGFAEIFSSAVGLLRAPEMGH
jgi:hypothetical protein